MFAEDAIEVELSGRFRVSIKLSLVSRYIKMPRYAYYLKLVLLF